MMTRKGVKIIIAELNAEVKGEHYTYNDYLRNKPLPLEMRHKCRKKHAWLMKREREIEYDSL